MDVLSLRATTLVLDVVGVTETRTVFALGDIDLGVSTRLAFDVEVDLGTTSWFLVAEGTRISLTIDDTDWSEVIKFLFCR